MLSSILKSEQAIKINIAIILTFVSLREFLSFNKELGAKLSLLEKRIEKHDEEIKAIFGAIRQLMAPAEAKKKGGDRDFEGERIHSSFAPAAPENVPSMKIDLGSVIASVACITKKNSQRTCHVSLMLSGVAGKPLIFFCHDLPEADSSIADKMWRSAHRDERCKGTLGE